MTDSPLTPDPDEAGVRGEVTDDRFVGARDLTHWYTPLGRLLARFAHWVSERLGPNAALIITLVIGMSAVIILSLVAADVYDAVTDKDGVAGLDLPILNAAIQLRSPALNAFAIGYTDIAGTIGMPIIAVTAILILAIARRSWTPVILIVAAGTGSLLMTIAGKDLIGRNRPPLTDAVPPYEYSPSFPSGHTLNAVVVVGIIAYLLILRRHSVHARVLLICGAGFYAFTVGLSRMYLGHHWFTDVLAAWALGAAWLTLIITAHRLYLTVRRRREQAASVGGVPQEGADRLRPQ
jgi:undecaprenyl-diphosphatase